MKLVVFGGGGKSARQVAQQRGSNEVLAVLRNDGHAADLEALGVKSRVLSLEDASDADIAALLAEEKPDAVLFAAGAGMKGDPRAVDLAGALKVYAGMEKAGVQRLVMISSMDVRDRSKGDPPHYDAGDKQMSERMWGVIERHLTAKYEAEVALHKTGLQYTVIRPGGLTDEPAKGAQVGVDHLRMTSRALVGQAVWAVLDTPGTEGLTLDVINGDGDLKAEVQKCAKERTDSFF